MICYSKFSLNKGCPAYDIHDPASNFYLTKITKNQRSRWKKRKTVPWQIIWIFESWGIDLGLGDKRQGTKLCNFLELLWNFFTKCSDKKTRDASFYLYEDSVKFELMMRKKISHKK